jgi:hypothetical protein
MQAKTVEELAMIEQVLFWCFSWKDDAMSWFTDELSKQTWRAIADGENQAMVVWKSGRENVGPLATMPLSETETTDDGEEVYCPDQSDMFRLQAVLMLPHIARLFAKIETGEYDAPRIRVEVRGICEAIEDTMELCVDSFELGIE